MFSARYASIPLTAAFVGAFCDRHRIARDDASRLTLVVEELLANTIRHGHGGESDAQVRVELARNGDVVALSYEDAAPPFDPLARLRDAPAGRDAPIASRPVGGVGLHLVGELADSAQYAREEGRNRLRLTLRLRGG